jgi:hypothetical protein
VTDAHLGEQPEATPSVARVQPLTKRPRFGQLAPLKVKDYFKDEARDFTPWLASDEGLALLGEAIGLTLELIGMEQRVGPFRADIVAREGDTKVIVENQLDATDHKHLGQLLVYAAGREANVVAWIARAVTDEHRAVIDWLNTETSVSFWALEFELWQIGDSQPAPRLNVVCEPNPLTQTAPDTTEVSGAKLLQLEFWKALAAYLEEHDTPFNVRKPLPQHWYDLPMGTTRAWLGLTALVNPGRVGCELNLGTEHADALFDELERDRQAFEEKLGELDWEPLPGKKTCRIAQYKTANIEHRESWDDLIRWLVERATTFRETFAERIKSVALPPAESG